MQTRTVVLATAGIAGVTAATRSVRRQIAAWDDNHDTCDGNPVSLPPGEEVVVTAADGAALRGLVAGPSDGDTVLLVHCWTGSIANWGPVARRLVDEGYRVVAVNQRGHGSSERGTAAYTPETLAADVEVWIRELDLHDLVCAGHSMGGIAAMAFAAHHRDLAAERLRGLVLVATLASPPRGPRGPAVSVDLRRAMPLMERSMGRGDLGLLGLLQVFGRAPARSQLEATRDSFLTTDPTARDDAVSMLTRFDLRPVLPDIELPAHVIAGSHDYLTFVPMNQEIADLIPGATIEVLDGMGHMLPWEAPDVVTDAIVAAHAAPVASA